MQNDHLFALPALAQVIDPHPLTVTPDTTVMDAIAFMSQARGRSCSLDDAKSTSTLSSSSSGINSYVLVTEGVAIRGIFTERDVVRLIAMGVNLANIQVGEVMTQQAITLQYSDAYNAAIPLSLMRQHQIRHLPIVDEQEKLLGIVTHNSLRQALQPANLLKLRLVREVMLTQVIHAPHNASVLDLAQQMSQHRVSCIVIVEAQAAGDSELIYPIGIVSERDIVQFRALNLDLAHTQAVTVMSTPIFTVKPEDSMWAAYQQMQQRYIRRLVVTGDRSELLGIVTQSSFLNAVDPLEVSSVIITLQQQIAEKRNELHQQILERQQLEVELQQSNERLKLALEAAQAGSWDWDMVKNETIWTPYHEIIFGYQPGTPKRSYQDWANRVHPEDLPEVQASMQKAIANRQNYICEYRIILPDNQIRWVNARGSFYYNQYGQAIRLVGVVDDITERKLAESVLRQAREELEIRVAQRTSELSQEKQAFRALADNAPDIIARLDSHFRHLYVNRAIEAETGLPAHEFIGKTNEELGMPADQLTIWNKTLTQVFTTSQPAEIEFEFPSPMGVKYYQSRCVPEFDQNGTVASVLIITRNITKQKQAELAVRQSEAKYRCIVETAIEGVWAVDAEGKTTLVNQQMASMLGYTIEEMQAKSLFEFMDAQGKAIALQYWQRRQPGIKEQHDFKFCDRNGRDVWAIVSGTPMFDENGEYIGGLGMITDITERKQAEQKMREQAALIDIATDAIFVTNLHNKILFWSLGSERLYGFDAAEAIEKTAQELFNDDASQLAAAMNSTLEKGCWRGELEQVTKAGTKIIVESRWTLVQEESGQPKSILIVNTDITEKKSLEKQFLRAQRLESLGTLASGIAHDLNNIFTPILSISQLLPLRIPAVDSKTQELVEVLTKSAKRGSDLVKQILMFSRGTEGKPICLQIGHLLLEVAKVITQTFPKSIEITTNIPIRTLWMVKGYPTQIHQILMNLCVNARDAMPDGGTLDISAENQFIDEIYARMDLNAQVGNYVVITISDTGTGIPPELMDRIFDPFFTTKEPGKGTGLGLSTVMSIVKNSGGFVQVLSQEGKGTKFKVYLPAIEAAINEQASAVTIPTGNQELVMIVDDEVMVQLATKTTLEQANYRTLVASDGLEAIAIYVQNQQEINLVLIDIMMPSLDGFTAIRTLKKLNPQLKIIATSGLPTQSREALAAGAQEFLAKPYTAADLLSTLSSLIINID
ncbi:multi-sensor hybrid histidine kinase [Tolypothrix tenuis PCC 7101]|uniref:histidine kinase n=1 Tax=Tolypothrix tenuis PCC 7101 TaxID=231146 RepID=A0A1Z4MXS2_9CYAN|nr:PAS domain S-box protein [Aulosira sp. FACHB-113]BAY98253.1 multi-sensor hybrid histidine kinase [Tolypothrix tenuis PCC 7101]BAZ77828.1 multi-sensor hybrid histidine kinase [Aulosira laxa NIES-50]